MPLSCRQHSAFIFDRGGQKKIATLAPLTSVKWERIRDDISEGAAYIAAPSKKCAEALALAESGRMELVIYRGSQRVWEGPINRITYRGASVTIDALDVGHYVKRTAIRNEYDSRYPNVEYVLDRVKRMMNTELARKEALDPPVNMLAHVKYLFTTPRTDARTAAHTLPFESTLHGVIDSYAARGGLDYTTVGRSMVFWDVHQEIGRTATVTESDFLGDVIITQYGSELATHVYITDGKGNAGSAGANDPYYGEWEFVQDAYDENAAGPDDDPDPSVAEMSSQAQRIWSQSKVPPLVVRVPDNTSLNPAGALSIDDLVPGVHIPLSAKLPGRTVSQLQKLDRMSVEESAGKPEEIKVTMSPAPLV